MAKEGRREGTRTFLRVVAAASALRAPVVVVAPLVPIILTDSDISAEVIGLATGATLFCFAAGAFLVPSLMRRWGPARLMSIGLLVCGVGILVRSIGSDGAFLVGTVGLGMGIGCLNVAVPSFINAVVSHPRLGGSLVAVGLNVGAIVAAATVVYVHELVGDWRVALCLPLVFLLAGWVGERRQSPPVATKQQHSVVATRSLRGSYALVLLVLFMGLQSTSYYVFLTWFSFALTRDGVSVFVAAMVISANQLGQLCAALAMSYLIRRLERFERLEPLFLLAMALGAVILLQNAQPALLVGGFVLGIGHGSGLAVALAHITVKSASEDVSRTVSVWVQGLGYAFAALGPLAVGVVTGQDAFRVILCSLMTAIGLALLLIWRSLRSCQAIDALPR